MINDNEKPIVFNRRDFLITTGAVVAGAAINKTLWAGGNSTEKKLFTIGLSQYSLRESIRSGKLKPVDYPAFAKETFGIDYIDVWDGTFPDGEPERMALAKELKKRADDINSRIFLFMAGVLDATSQDDAERKASAQEVTYWMDHAAVMGCTYYRIFLKAADTTDEIALDRAAMALSHLSKMAKERKLKIAIEPGASRLSSSGTWLASLVKEKELPDVVLMPDFGKLKKEKLYTDTEAMMPYSQVVSAKSIEFDEQGLEVNFDYPRLLEIIVNSGFRNIVAIEYEGSKLPEVAGIQATQKLLEKIHSQLLSNCSANKE